MAFIKIIGREVDWLYIDTANGNIVVELLGKLAHDEGYAVIIITHDMSIADRADVVYTMKDGKLTEKSIINESGRWKYAVKKQSETNGKDEGKNNCFSFAYGTDGYVFVSGYQPLADMQW